VEAVVRLARRRRAGGHLDLAGLMIERRGPTLLIGPPAGRSGARARLPAFRETLPVPGSVDIPAAGLSVTASLEASAAPEALTGRSHGAVAVVRASSLGLPLVVRTRQPGDRVRPAGAPGRRKLQDLLVDRKVPRDERDRVPIVVDASGRIVWVVGLAIAEECRVTTPETSVVVLKVRRTGLPVGSA
jgi:tRNA(Ile)-lysidine synthase